MPAPILHLYTPGLVEALSASEAAAVHLPPLPGIQRILARARREPSPARDLSGQLLHAFGAAPASGLAALTHLADTGQLDERWWLRADPVYLQADQDRLVLFAGEGLQLPDDEAQQLCRELDEHFQDRGWRFEASVAARWYLGLAQDPRVNTVAIDEVMGLDINSRLPAGDSGGAWRAVLNEAQMLLHTSPVNQAREARGALPVNSVWFWGEGRLPAAVRSSWTSVGSDEPVALGLARLAGQEAVPLPQDLHTWCERASAGEHLLVCSTLQRCRTQGDLAAWREEVLHLERAWLAPAQRAVAAGLLQALHWWPGGSQVYTIDRRSMRRFWRRVRAVPIASRNP